MREESRLRSEALCGGIVIQKLLAQGDVVVTADSLEKLLRRPKEVLS
jgi:hypothetical protein